MSRCVGTSGTPTDSEDTLRFAELTGVRPMIETYPLEKADEAYARLGELMIAARPSPDTIGTDPSSLSWVVTALGDKARRLRRLTRWSSG